MSKKKKKKIDVTKSDAYLKSIVKIHEDYTYTEKIVQLTYRIKSLKTIMLYTNSTSRNDGVFFVSFNRLKVVS